MIRIDTVRALHHDLHMRPFEGDRRVYVVLDAHLLNEDAADALLKDLEEPPPYATLVLVADELGPLPETIRSRCQLVPFHRLSDRAVRGWIEERADGLDAAQVTALARVAAGRLDRAGRLLDPATREQREALIEGARSVYGEAELDVRAAAAVVLDASSAAGALAREREEA
jgi:DNA polymerase-3 subunit delta'